jgi:hypothetical protein
MGLTIEAQNIYNNFILDCHQIWKLPIDEQQVLVQSMFAYAGNHINHEIDNAKNRIDWEKIEDEKEVDDIRKEEE